MLESKCGFLLDYTNKGCTILGKLAHGTIFKMASTRKGETKLFHLQMLFYDFLLLYIPDMTSINS